MVDNIDREWEDLYFPKNTDYIKLFNDYFYTENIVNNYPKSEIVISRPLIVLDGWYLGKGKPNDSIIYAYIKENSFLFVLKYNILKRLLELNLINQQEINEVNITPYIGMSKINIAFPSLVYYKYHGAIIDDYKFEFSRGYVSITINEILIYPILPRTNSNQMWQISEICKDEMRKLKQKLKK